MAVRKKKIQNIKLVDFPEEVDEQNGIKVYGETSWENQLAVLSQYLHNNVYIGDEDSKQEIIYAIREFLERKKSNKDEEITDEYVIKVAENPIAYNLFSDFFKVPFPNPKFGQHTFIDLFAGIGGIRLPFNEMGYRCVFSSEWDKYAQQTYLANFGEMPFGDITKEVTKKYIPKHFDLLLAGFPCQAFSIMGKMQGFADIRGTMFFEVATILERHQPEAVLLENVKQLTTHDQGRTFSTILRILGELGYHVKWQVLNALDFGLPQKRERVIIVGFRSQQRCDAFNFDFKKKTYNLKEILEDDKDIDPSLFASDMILQKRQKQTEGKTVFYPSIWHENKAGNVSVLDYACALRTGASYNYLLVNGQRRLSSRELLRLQGFPDNYKIAVSHGEIRRQTGNSVAVPMIREIARKIDYILNNI
ncbi:DNA cytosine methyltransferase [Bacteroides oleiciplenus]|uniref:Cytosine-specific methyltransferase n=1 Tax=Bacteroides oleiciplenus YIT 12058 TaxID=742727 RepID=K9EEV5_9BACE|nr:DNA (cytosine-5-)-methyltransferase [Bacteroides oleiciplenus]EKU89452.1 DNA (cytosine-5-)-methyltransferase [Bacteroides oleiciplenus YIT 12058]